MLAYSDELAKIRSQPFNHLATALAMSVGLHAVQFYGDVYVGKFGQPDGGANDAATSNMPIAAAALVLRPDLRVLAGELEGMREAGEWQRNAAAENYRRAGAVAVLSVAMQSREEKEGGRGDDDEDDDEYENEDNKNEKDPPPVLLPPAPPAPPESRGATPTFCLSCRRPSDSLCPGCFGASRSSSTEHTLYLPNLSLSLPPSKKEALQLNALSTSRTSLTLSLPHTHTHTHTTTTH